MSAFASYGHVAALALFCHVPRADICSGANYSLFDHVVGNAEQSRRHGEAERSGSLAIDD
jgi:hypothetical protein